MNKRQTRSAKVQKAADPQHLPKQHPVRQPEQGPVQKVSPQVAYQRTQVSGNGLRPVDLLVLQRTMGNRALQRMVKQGMLNANSPNKETVVTSVGQTEIGRAQNKTAVHTYGDLAHMHVSVSHSRHRNIISRWGGNAHKEMTSEVGEALGIGGMALTALRRSSIGMDWRVRRLIKAGWRAVFERPAFTIKAEGPDHGEGGWYKLDWEAAKAANIARQNDYLERAIKAYQDYRDRRRSPSDALEEMYKSLGDALHVAQDRGAHNEGTKGFGHNDPRLKDGYDPDNPAHNPSGVRAALENTYDVLSTFLAKTGLRNAEQGHMGLLRF